MEMVIIWIVVIAFFVAGICGVVVPVLPSAPLVWVGIVIYALAVPDSSVGMGTVALTGFLTLVAVAVDVFAGVLGAKAGGASWYGVLGALCGGAVGMVVFSVLGLIVGTMLGAFVGELVRARRVDHAVRASVSTVIGFVVNGVAQIFFVVALLVIFFVRVAL